MILIKIEITNGVNFDINVKITQNYFMPSKPITVNLKLSLFLIIKHILKI